MGKKILITGATGLIGKKLYQALNKRGDEITIFTTSKVKAMREIPGAHEFIEWDYRKPGEWQKYIDGKDIIIHLAGANLFGKRWNDEYKKIIIESRQASTRNIVNAICEAHKKPEAFICASAVGYYGDYGENVITEETLPGNDFVSNVCKIWEAEASMAEQCGVRTVSIRTGIVLTKDDGALKQMLLPFKLFVGGPLGSGKQWFPWIHITDIINSYIFAIDNPLRGSVNAVAPDPVTMKSFTKTLGKVMHRPSFFHVPEFVLKIVVGEFEKTLGYSQKIIPKKLLEEGFKFEYGKLEDALRKLLI